MSAEWVKQVLNCELSHGEKSVLFVMAWFADKKGGNIFATARSMARYTGYKERQVRGIMHSLAAKGCLVLTHRHGLPNGSYVRVFQLDFRKLEVRQELPNSDRRERQQLHDFGHIEERQISPGVRQETAESAANVADKTSRTDKRNNLLRRTSGDRKNTSSKPSHEAEQLARHLHDRILANKPDFRITPAQLENWALEADRMLRIDGRKFETARSLIDWVTSDSFWRSNILSMDKFRKQYDRLEMKRNETPHKKGGKDLSWVDNL